LGAIKKGWKGYGSTVGKGWRGLGRFAGSGFGGYHKWAQNKLKGHRERYQEAMVEANKEPNKHKRRLKKAWLWSKYKTMHKVRQTGAGLGYVGGGLATGAGAILGAIGTVGGAGVGALATLLGLGAGAGLTTAGLGVGAGLTTAGLGVGAGLTTAGLGVGAGLTTAGLGVGAGLTTAGLGVGAGLTTAGLGAGVGLTTAGLGAGVGLTTAGLGLGVGGSVASYGAGTGLGAGIGGVQGGLHGLSEYTIKGVKEGGRKLWNPFRKKGKGYSSQVTSARTDVGTTALNVINSSVNQAVGSTLEAGSTGAITLTAISGPLATLIGTIKGIVSSARAHRARKRQNLAEETAMRLMMEEEERDDQRVEQALQQSTDWVNEQDAVPDEVAQTESNDKEEFLNAVLYMAGKNKAKKWRSILEASGAFTGVVGSTALTAGLLATGVGLTALLASNPVGWGIALGAVGLGALTAVGYGFFKMAKAIYKWRKGTKGVNRQHYATVLYGLAKKGYQPAIDFLKEMRVLKGGGRFSRGKFSMAELNSGRNKDKQQIIAYLMGKMKST
ncbi:MAG: hypothetical protein KC415_17700, partial [Anaerolineales bacterium]|nr:hypothetical protein [Anaerolineales bacterium]